MRQLGDSEKQFRDILISIHKGELSVDQWKLLSTRALENLPEEERQLFKTEGTMLCSRRPAVARYNNLRVDQLEAPKALIEAVNRPPQAAREPAQNAGNLQNKLKIANGCKVILRTNLWREMGLVNGAQGKIWKIIYSPGRTPPDLPDCVLVEIPQFLGESPKGIEKPKIVPIVPIERSWWSAKDKVMYSRRALPIDDAYGITIHSSQGMNMPGKTLIDLGDREFSCGLTYTALSRCTNFQQIAFTDPMPTFKRMTGYFKHQLFKDRLEEDKRLAKLVLVDTENVNTSDSETEENEVELEMEYEYE